ncbi:MAG: phosphogluconate dehydratase [Pseudohongiella sp.]|uniref:phosphogluconate dehydratase n=1 Tax=Pseudohongiella sp. TaxID=1979412 RepID=UPI0034A03A2B
MPQTLNTTVEQVTERIRTRSHQLRQTYLQNAQRTMEMFPPRKTLSCGNIAHAFAACQPADKTTIAGMKTSNLGIVTAYNDMLSAHQPLQSYPDIIKAAARGLNCTAQVAGGVPAMCDGVTQGQPGMELSLFSREVIAMATAVSLSHNVFDGILCLGVCDKIVPGLLIGALQFGHLPAGFIPAGPMGPGVPNKTKAEVRQRYAQGNADRDELLAVESASYHSPGTCNFYGTANSNQVMVEMLGVQLPGASFVNPDDPLREALTRETVYRVLAATVQGQKPRPLTELICEGSLVNAAVGLLASGGSTNHTLHLVAIARAAGIILTWQDLDELSHVTPLLARVYPNGEADVNAFQEAGGMAYLVRELRSAGLLNEQVSSLMGEGMAMYAKKPILTASGTVQWVEHNKPSHLPDVLRPADKPFSAQGGLKLIHGNLGEGVVKTSAVKAAHQHIKAPCRVFNSQDDMVAAFKAGELQQDVIAVVRFQGPKANGMPELHQLTPCLGALQDQGFQVALVTDGRMSGASGKVAAAIHMSPEALDGGPLSRLRDGDPLLLNAGTGQLDVLLDDDVLNARENAIFAPAEAMLPNSLGRGLFETFRQAASVAHDGASVFK